MKKRERFLSCILLAIICNFIVSMHAQASCGLTTTHAGNITELSNLLPGDARGALAVDINALLNGTSSSQVTALLNGTNGDPALKEPFSAINKLAANIDLAGVMDTAFLVQTTDASDGFLLLAKLSCDTIGEVTITPALTVDSAYRAHAMYLDVNGNSLSLMAGGVLVVGKLAAVQSVLDVADGASNTSHITPFLSALLSMSPFSFIYGLPAMYNSITPDRSLMGAKLVSGSLAFSGSNISGSVSFHTSNASSFVDAYNQLNRHATDADVPLEDPLTLAGSIASGLGQVVVNIPSTPINKTGDDLIISRNTLKKLIFGMNAHDYAENVDDDSHSDDGNPAWLDLVVKSAADGDTPLSPGSVFIRRLFKDDAEYQADTGDSRGTLEAYEQDELPEGFTVAPCQFLESDDPDGVKSMLLNLYNSGGGSIVKGARAEWDVFVNPPVGADPDAGTRPRFLVIDALAEGVSADPVHIITSPEPLSHKFELFGILVVSSVAKYDIDGVTEIPVFSSRFPKPNPATAPVARFTREMAISNDYIYWGHGVYDRALYNATTFNWDAYFVAPAQLTYTDNSKWDKYLKPVPKDVIYYVNTLEYVASPMENLDSTFLDITTEHLADLLAYKNNGHEKSMMREFVEKLFRGVGDTVGNFYVENTTPATYYNFEITDPTGMATELNLPAGYSLAQTTFFEQDPPAPEAYYLTLSVYEIKDSIEGIRAEWSVYVDNGNGRERLMIIDLQTEDAALDPVSMINLPSVVSHNLAGGILSTSLSSSTIDFDASFSTVGTTDEALTLDWIEAGDNVCHLNGVCDKLYYDAETLDVPVHVPGSPTVTISTPWNAYINTTASAVFYRDNLQEYAVKSWQNLKVEIDELEIEIPPGTHVVFGTGTLRGRLVSYVDSDYIYFGSATLNDNVMNFVFDQTIDSMLGTAHMFFSGSLDLTTGVHTQTVLACSGPVMLCGAANADVGKPAAKAVYVTENLVASDL